MFHEMRRKKQELTAAEAAAVLARGTCGVLALSGDDGYPYAVPVSYVLDGEKLFFHSAPTGHKVDAIRRNDKASFCVIDQNELHPETYTTQFRSVIAFGRVRVVTDESERRAALLRIAEKYGPDDAAGQAKEVEATLPRACLIELAIEHLSGKQAKELVK
ncbi:MAG TPA: pyridoxamine 5'-phosphate oxidase family protein [Oscillospiraceae bacterium]|nr:pyridoxamine 5'-phosphate oxidase family protein [Oscillospiraceae bacterium]HNY00714.1 pyridoxamine 5'-phosphate oxidase family protein [Oscillospiraceae bacterium]HPS75715.1 pyridoxamine 5'-phosphate oxidase family protein [Oscillospiraceae bacterium]